MLSVTFHGRFGIHPLTDTAVDDGCQTPESEAVLMLQAYLWRFCFIALSNEYRN